MDNEKKSLNEENKENNEKIHNSGEDTEVEVRVVDDEVPKDALHKQKDGDHSGTLEAEEQAGVEAEQEAAEEEPPESERYLRLAAEFDNYKKRTTREFGEIIKGANARLLRELIEIKDNFERALDEKATLEDHDSYRKGVELIYNQLTELLKKENIVPIEAVGKSFDPLYHEAMMQQESDEYEEGIVCQELQRGYLLEERILRHARVVVSSGRKGKDKSD